MSGSGTSATFTCLQASPRYTLAVAMIAGAPKRRRCLLMALFGHPTRTDECPLLGAKRTVTNRFLPVSIYEYTA